MGKKLLTVLLILTIAISATACGKKKRSDDEAAYSSNNTQAVDQSNDAIKTIDEYEEANENEVKEDIGSSDGIYGESGNELTDFFDAFDDAMGEFERAVNGYEPEEFEFFDIGFDYIAPTTCILSIGSYDSLDVLGSKEGEYREDSGGVISFGKEFTREEDGFGPSAKKGDVTREEGNLDTSSNTLLLERTVERSGELLVREVAEVYMLTDGTFVAQILSKQAPQGNVEDKGNAYFVHCSKDELEIIKASFEPDVNFTYTSIVGKGNISPEDMSQGYVKIRKLAVRDDKASAEKY